MLDPDGLNSVTSKAGREGVVALAVVGWRAGEVEGEAVEEQPASPNTSMTAASLMPVMGGRYADHKGAREPVLGSIRGSKPRTL